MHPGDDPDVSADLLELARTPGLLVCSGPKSIIDPAATAEKLEELGVALVGYGVDRLPFFLAREASGRPGAPRRHTGRGRRDRSAPRAIWASPSTVLLLQPGPRGERDGRRRRWRAAVAEAEARAERDGVHGKERTPFLLAALAEITGGRSLRANLALLEDNARVAGAVAAALAAG